MQLQSRPAPLLILEFTMLKRLIQGLGPCQLSCVAITFVASFFLALALACAFRHYNGANNANLSNS